VTQPNRRTFVLALGTAPLWLPALPVACAHREETPLAHLYGQDWVHGAYEMYAGKYAAIQTSSEQASKNAYAMLAQKGVVALDALQTREVPFFIRVDDGERGFTIARDVPERLKFTADMSDADRTAAQARWEAAREHIQTDYEEIRRLDWALTTLLSQAQAVRSAIENGKVEQYHLVHQLSVMDAGERPPFELPYQVGVDDYRDVLTLLIERLDDDGERLGRVESDIVTVGLTARSTDSGSASLAANLHKVLLAVVTDASASTPRAATFPRASDERAQYLARGKELCASIKASAEYAKWDKEESAKAFDQLGKMLSLVDSMTGLKVSAIYRQVLDIWRGDADYLSYLKTLASVIPGGGEVAKTIASAIDLTDKARKVAGKVQTGIATAKTAIDTGKRLASGGLPSVPNAASVVELANGSGLLNAGSNFARSKLDKQLAFFKDHKELAQIKSAIAESPLMTSMLANVPGVGGGG
jgi:hypothetical protein